MTEGAGIEVLEVTVEVKGKVLLDRVSLRGGPGERIAVFGASGSGKTTLLRVIAGLEERLTRGSVSLDGVVASAPGGAFMPPHQRGVALLFQDLALWPHMTVEQHLRFPLGSSGLPRGQVCRRVDEAIVWVGLGGRDRTRPGELSGGEQQRLALARALISRPRRLLLDEPFSSLDLPLRREMSDLVLDLHRRLGFTLLLVTHDPAEVSALAERVVVLDGGRVSWTGPAAAADSWLRSQG